MCSISNFHSTRRSVTVLGSEASMGSGLQIPVLFESSIGRNKGIESFSIELRNHKMDLKQKLSKVDYNCQFDIILWKREEFSIRLPKAPRISSLLVQSHAHGYSFILLVQSHAHRYSSSLLVHCTSKTQVSVMEGIVPFQSSLANGVSA